MLILSNIISLIGFKFSHLVYGDVNNAQFMIGFADETSWQTFKTGNWLKTSGMAEINRISMK